MSELQRSRDRATIAKRTAAALWADVRALPALSSSRR